MTKENKNPDDPKRQGRPLDSSLLPSFILRHFREWSVAAALCVLLLLLALLAPNFFRAGQLLYIASTAIPVLLVSCGIALVIISRQIDISVGSQFALCSIFVGLLIQ